MQKRFINTFNLIDKQSCRLPVLSIRGERQGPVVCLCAGIHGNEPVGIRVIQEIFRRLTPQGLSCGEIHALPVLNPFGMPLGEKNVPFDGENLNRCFPGDFKGNVSERLAAIIYREITALNPDLVIDFHATATRSIPYIILERTLKSRAEKALVSSAEYAQAFGITQVFEHPAEEYQKYKLEKSLTGQLLNRNRIPALVAELGPSGYADERFVKAGVTGTLNLLNYLGMAKIKTPWKEHPSKINVEYPLRRLRVTVNSSGVLDFQGKQPGEPIKKGHVGTYVRDIFGEVVEEVKVIEDSYILYLPDHAVVLPGMKALALAVRAQ